MSGNRKKEELQFKSRGAMLFYFMKGAGRYFIPAVLFACLVVLFELINPKIIGYTVDIIIDDYESVPGFAIEFLNRLGGRSFVLSNLWLVALTIIGIALIGAAFRYLFKLFNVMGAERLVKRMRDTLYQRIVNLPFSWQDANKAGDIIQRCTSDVDMIKNFLSEQLTNLFRMIIMISLALYFMSGIHPYLTLAAASFIPVVVLYSLLFHNKVGSAFEKVDNEEGRVSAIVQENLTGVRVVRAFGKEGYERERFENKNEIYTGLWVHMMKVLATFWMVNDILSGVQILTVLSLGTFFTVKGQMTPGDFVAFGTLNGILTFPVRQLGRTISEMSKAGISVDRLMYIMNSEPEKDSENADAFPEKYDIRFENVTFGYNDKTVLKDISFEIPEGTTLGVLGGTGSGKSTMLMLLENLYTLSPENGNIYIGGKDIRNIKKSELRKNVGMVLQEPYLFSGTLEENIMLSKEDSNKSDVEEAARMSALDGALKHFKEGYNTYVGERGVTLSGGQKQRTAIAQMLIRKTPIMILDDSMSAVDTQTDARIRKGIREASGKNSVILVSHRITTLMQADMILVLENGAIVQRGTHEELIKQSGIYKHIYDLQCNAMEGEDEED